MKPLPPPKVPGNTEWERFDNAVGMLLSAPNQAFAKQEKKQADAGQGVGGEQLASLPSPLCLQFPSQPIERVTNIFLV